LSERNAFFCNFGRRVRDPSFWAELKRRRVIGRIMMESVVGGSDFAAGGDEKVVDLKAAGEDFSG
jgi:hypothetical protein